MNNKTKKWMIVAGGLMICAVLVALIGSRFSPTPLLDNSPIVEAEDAPSGITVDPQVSVADVDDITDDAPAVVIKPDTQKQTENSAVSTGTAQTIQPDVSKPEPPDDEALRDPTKTPDGQDVSEPPTPVDHDNVPAPTDPPTQPSQPSGGLPGFDNVPNAGANQVTSVDGDGDINKQVGIMD